MSRQRSLTKKNQNKPKPWANTPKPWHGSGFYQDLDIENLDNRTIIGKTVQNLKLALREYVGNSPSIVTDLIISRIVYKCIKLSLYETQCLQDPQNIEAQHYLPMANSLRLDLESLAKQAGEAKPLSLDDYLQNLQQVAK
jgi:hypothetical protein